MCDGGGPDLPDGWVVWSDDGTGRAVYAFRPDVFEGQSFPAACLPTIYVSTRRPDQRRRSNGRPDSTWHVSLFLEPEVRVRDRDESFDSRGAAVAAAVELAESFVAGDIDVRAAYQVPRETYLEELERLTGRDA